jgi:hypothetical protein
MPDSIGWATAAITLASVLFLTVLSAKEGTWELKRKLQFEANNQAFL